MNRSVQAHPYHLVEPSPWPLAVSFALLTTTLSAVMYFHGYSNGGFLLILGILATVSIMTLWFKDVSREGMNNRWKVPSLNLTVCWKILRAFGTNLVTIQRIGQSAGNLIGFLRDYTLNIGRFMLTSILPMSYSTVANNDNLFNSYGSVGPYLAGLLEGDGHIEIQSEESNYRKLNPIPQAHPCGVPLNLFSL
jgi:Cytochrome c oxidase subunit III